MPRLCNTILEEKILKEKNNVGAKGERSAAGDVGAKEDRKLECDNSEVIWKCLVISTLHYIFVLSPSTFTNSFLGTYINDIEYLISRV